MLWARVSDQSFDFARNKELAHLLSNGTVTLDDVRDMHQRALSPAPTNNHANHAVAFNAHSAAASSAAARGGRMLVWVLPQKGEAAAAEPTADTAPQGYALVTSLDKLRKGSSYFPKPAVAEHLLADRADSDAMAERFSALRPEASAAAAITGSVVSLIAKPQPLSAPPAKACSQAPCSSEQEGRGPNAHRHAAVQRGYRHAK